ncbi:Uncharacterised protein [Candidatus Gugararchaeum adminiculabundum]|nr:Uncharacterised protein [Candidatus Gugararchaeum adminiculabundum]
MMPMNLIPSAIGGIPALLQGASFIETGQPVQGGFRDVWTGSLAGGQSWEWYALAAIMLTFFAALLMYMFSIIMQSDSMKKWAQRNFIEVLASVLIVVLLMGIVSGVIASVGVLTETMAHDYHFDLTVIAMGKNPQSPFDLTYAFLSKQIGCEKKYFMYSYWANYAVEFVEKSTIGTVWGEPISGWPLAPSTNLFHSINHSISYLLIGQYLMWHLLWFCEHTMFVFFLPLGIVLRTFPLTRGVGAFLMALAIGMFLILPLTFSLQIVLYTRGLPQTASSTSSVTGCAIQPVSADMSALVQEQCNNGEASTVGAQVYEYLKNRDKSIGMGERLKAELTMLTFIPFWFALAAVMTLTAVRAMAQLFGTDTQELGRGMFKLL